MTAVSAFVFVIDQEEADRSPEYVKDFIQVSSFPSVSY
jgi:hypothetical protein